MARAGTSLIFSFALTLACAYHVPCAHAYDATEPSVLHQSDAKIANLAENLALQTPGTHAHLRGSALHKQRRLLDAINLRSEESAMDVWDDIGQGFVANKDVFSVFLSEDSIEAKTDQLRSFTNSDDWERRSLVYLMIAKLYLENSENLVAITAANDALDTVPAGNFSKEADQMRLDIFELLQALHALDYDLESATIAAERMLAVSERSNLGFDGAGTLHNMAFVAIKNGESPLAIKLLEAAIPNVANTAPNMLHYMYAGLGRAHFEQENFEDAIDSLNEALKNTANQNMTASILYRLSFAYAELGNIEQSKVHLLAATEVTVSEGVRSRYAGLQHQIEAKIAAFEGDYEQAYNQLYETHQLVLSQQRSALSQERQSTREEVLESEAVLDERQKTLQAELAAEAERAYAAEMRSTAFAVFAFVLLLASLWILILYKRTRRQADALTKSHKILEHTNGELKIMGVRAQAGEQAKSDFLSIVSHELRTPLNGILPIVEILQRNEVDGQRNKLLDIAKRNSMALLGMVENIMTLSDRDQKNLINDPVTCQLGSHLAKTVDDMKRGKDVEGLSVEFHDHTQSESFVVDATKLQRALRCILDNAIRFTEHGRVDIDLGMASDDTLRVRIRDTGPGMNEDVIERARKIFTQADTSHTRRKDGLGIGLAVADRLMNIIGGEMVIDSVIGEGTCVDLLVPVGAHKGAGNDLTSIGISHLAA